VLVNPVQADASAADRLGAGDIRLLAGRSHRLRRAEGEVEDIDHAEHFQSRLRDSSHTISRGRGTRR